MSLCGRYGMGAHLQNLHGLDLVDQAVGDGPDLVVEVITREMNTFYIQVASVNHQDGWELSSCLPVGNNMT